MKTLCMPWYSVVCIDFHYKHNPPLNKIIRIQPRSLLNSSNILMIYQLHNLAFQVSNVGVSDVSFVWEKCLKSLRT